MDGKNLARAAPGQKQPESPGDALQRAVWALWRSRYLVIASAVLAGLVCFFALKMRASVYEARATLLVQTPAFSTELKPKALSIETYRSIIQSDFVVNKLLARLIQEEVLPKETALESLLDNLEVEIYAHRETERPGARDYLPLLDLAARAKSPDDAAKIANTWAEVFLAESDGLLGQLKQGNLSFIEAQYPQISETLKSRESLLREKEDFYDDKLLQLRQRLEMRILDAKASGSENEGDLLNRIARTEADYSAETARLLSEYEEETEKLRLEFVNAWKIDLLKQNLALKTGKSAQLNGEMLDIDLAIKTERDTLALLKQQIQDQPRFLVLSKAITDQALWDRIGSDPSDRVLERLNELKLKTEEVNPAHTHLLNRLIESQIRYQTLGPKREHLSSEIEKLGEEIDRASDLITEKEIAFEKLVRSRALGLAALKRDRELGLATLSTDNRIELASLRERNRTELELLETEKKNDLTRLAREKEVLVGQVRREKESVQKTYDLLAEKYEAARLARAEGVSDITLGGRAITPARPVDSGGIAKILLAALTGLLVAALMVVAWEQLWWIRAVNRSDGPTQAETQAATLKTAVR